jgi:hypothetical protein
MWVRDNDVSNGPALLIRGADRKAAGIDSD